MPFPTEVVQVIQHVQAMTRRKRRAHLYSTRELCSTHVPREEEEEDEEKNTAWLSHQHCHMARPRKVEPGAPRRTTLWVPLCAHELDKLPPSPCEPCCARELSKLPAHDAFPTCCIPVRYWYALAILLPVLFEYYSSTLVVEYEYSEI